MTLLPDFVLTLSYARYLRLSDHWFWRLGFGVGGSSGLLGSAVQVAVEPVGIAFRTGAFLLELVTPSFRYSFAPEPRAGNPDNWESFMFLLGLGLVAG